MGERTGRGLGGGVIAVATPGAGPGALELRALTAAGLAAVPVHAAEALRGVVAQYRPDLVLLDIELCPTTVIEVLAELATASGPAVILCGSLSDPSRRAALLCAGADDCVRTPYLLDELVARVLAVLRRTQRDRRETQCVGTLVAGSMRVDVDHHSLTINGRQIALTLLEFRLLLYLLRNRGVALSRERLLVDVWGYTIGTLETVTVHIRRLRSKIETDPSRPAWIETVWGVGYRFRAESEDRDFQRACRTRMEGNRVRRQHNNASRAGPPFASTSSSWARRPTRLGTTRARLAGGFTTPSSGPLSTGGPAPGDTRTRGAQEL